MLHAVKMIDILYIFGQLQQVEYCFYQVPIYQNFSRSFFII
jgi:hypothetical protein